MRSTQTVNLAAQRARGQKLSRHFKNRKKYIGGGGYFCAFGGWKAIFFKGIWCGGVWVLFLGVVVGFIWKVILVCELLLPRKQWVVG